MLLAVVLSSLQLALLRAESWKGMAGVRRSLLGMRVLDYWQCDGLELKWAHRVNDWPYLQQQLNDPFLNKSQLLEGDVLLRHSPPVAAVMNIPPTAMHTMTLKRWLAAAGPSNKALKINVQRNEVVKPALHHIFAAKKLLKSPIMIHADVWKGPESSDRPVNRHYFVRHVSRLLPDVTISLGWTHTRFPFLLDNSLKRYSWGQAFEMLESVYPLHQPVVFSLRATMAGNSQTQLQWLLGVRESFSLLIRADSRDLVADWTPLVRLRRATNISRILYDLPSAQMDSFRQALLVHNETVNTARRRSTKDAADMAAWRVVEFASARQGLSTAVLSDGAAALLGWPSALLLSERPADDGGGAQSVAGRVLFVRKAGVSGVRAAADTGLSIWLLDSADALSSPAIANGIQVFIGSDGRVFIHNRSGGHRQTNRWRPLRPKAVSRMAPHNCYGFRAVDTGVWVRLNVWTARCDGDERRPPARSWRRSLRLDVAPSARQRRVVVQKTGDAAVDALVQRLRHSAASSAQQSAATAASLLALCLALLVTG